MLWLVFGSVIVDSIATNTALSGSAVRTASGLLFVAGTGATLWLLLHRWNARLADAADAEARVAEQRRDVTRIRAAFLGSISHELRTPLTNVVGCAETIRTHHERLPSEQVGQLAGRLVENGQRLEQMVLDLLDLHDSPDQDTPLVLEPTRIDDLLEEVVSERTDCAHDVRVWTPLTWVELDQQKVRRMATEMVDNVVRHTPAGTTGWMAAWVEDGELRLSIEDDGPGIEPSIRSAAAKPFIQGEHVAEDASPGLGIGLSLVLRYAEWFNGSVSLNAPPGGGTRVDVALPHTRTAVPVPARAS